MSQVVFVCIVLVGLALAPVASHAQNLNDTSARHKSVTLWENDPTHKCAKSLGDNVQFKALYGKFLAASLAYMNKEDLTARQSEVVDRFPALIEIVKEKRPTANEKELLKLLGAAHTACVASGKSYRAAHHLGLISAILEYQDGRTNALLFNLYAGNMTYGEFSIAKTKDFKENMAAFEILLASPSLEALRSAGK